MSLLRYALAAVACGSLSGCLYYDSRWGQTTAEQKHAAARLTAASVEGRKSGNEEVHRTATVRACATRAYAAETLSWQDRFDELLRTASSVLEPTIGLTLKNGGTSSWSPPHGEGSLTTVIDDLPSCEGPEADWVIALVESTPKVVSDFHVLGRGAVYSPFLAMRASNDPAEIEALAQALPDLDAATRDKLYSDRKRHKALTLFLHELGHTLGAVHRMSKTTIMHFMYDASERSYDDATLSLMRGGLSIRLDHANRYAAARAVLEADNAGFVGSERASQMDLLAALERSAAPVNAPVTTSPTSAPLVVAVKAVGFETLSKEERQTFDAATRLEATSAHDAWQQALPLFESHPAVREVQDLRCRLAKERRFFPSVVEAHCARLIALGSGELTQARTSP